MFVKKPRLRRLGSGKNIVAGEQIVDTICSPSRDGPSAQVLEQIAASCDGARIARVFPQEWGAHGNTRVKKGVVKFADREFPLTVVIGGESEGEKTLVLQNGSGTNCSMRPANGAMELRVGSLANESCIRSLAAQTVGTWVVHGQDWCDRTDVMYRRPWGNEAKGVLEKLYFEVVDGALETPRPTIGDLIRKGCYRHTHTGEWDATRQTTIIAALVGMPMTLHEFKEKGGRDVCFFRGLEIGLFPDVWGVYCPWNESTRRSGQLGIWRDLALRCSSPFSFHIQATRTIFPHARLDSDYILETIGHDKLHAVLALMATQQPERFYRLVDEQGFTHKLTGVGKDELVFGKHKLARGALATNALQTFFDLQTLQANPGFMIGRRPRVVIDSHAYIVIEALARQSPVVYDLSGRYMHEYLTRGQDRMSHRARNERLFLLLRDIFGVQSVKFCIYPPLTYNSGISSQYDANLAGFNKQEYLTKSVM